MTGELILVIEDNEKFPAMDALQLVERDFVRVPPTGAPCPGGRSYVRARHIAVVITRLGQTL